MSFENIIIEYVKKVEEVPYVGHMAVHVKVSDKPIFENSKSMKVAYFSEPFEGRGNGFELGSTTISYRSAKVEDYRQRMEVKIVLPNSRLRDRDKPYQESKKATQRLLRDIIAEHERIMSARK